MKSPAMRSKIDVQEGELRDNLLIHSTFHSSHKIVSMLFLISQKR